MEQAQAIIEVRTCGQGLVDVTAEIRKFVDQNSIQNGLLTLLIRHTSASLVIQENADPDVLADLLTFFQNIAPRLGNYRHICEGPDDMPAHIRSALTQTSLSIPVMDGQLALGVWQGIYVFEHRDRAHLRQIVAHLIGR